jgi:hypothetical protein
LRIFRFRQSGQEKLNPFIMSEGLKIALPLQRLAYHVTAGKPSKNYQINAHSTLLIQGRTAVGTTGSEGTFTRPAIDSSFAVMICRTLYLRRGDTTNLAQSGR